MALSNSSIEPAKKDQVEPAWDDRQARWDERSNEGTDGSLKGTTSTSMAAYRWLALLIVASGVVNVLSATRNVTRFGGVDGLRTPLLLEITSAVALIVLLPVLRYAVAQFYRNQSRARAVLIALLAASLYALLHEILMVLLRKLVFGIVADGYSFHWATDLPYEFRKDIVSALMIVVVFWLLDRRSLARPDMSIHEAVTAATEPAAKSPKPEIWLHDGTKSLRVDPRDIVSVTSAGNYVEFDLPDGRHLIRGTLAGEETRLRQFGIVRIHRTRLVNLGHVAAIELRPAGGFQLRMDNGETVVGSRRFKHAVTGIRKTAPLPQTISMGRGPIRQ